MDALQMNSSTKAYLAMSSFFGGTYCYFMRSQLPPSALKMQMVSLGGGICSQLLLNKNGAKKEYQLLTLAMIAVGSYFGRVTLKTACISTIFLGGTCIALGNYFLIYRFERDVEAFKEHLQDSKTVITPSITRQCRAFLEDPRQDNRWDLEWDLGNAMFKNPLNITESDIDDLLSESWDGYTRCCVMVGFDRARTNEKFQQEVYQSRIVKAILPVDLIFLKYLLKSKSYQEDPKIREALLRYTIRDEDTRETPLWDVARVACSVSEAFARRNFLPKIGDPFYYPILAAILDSTSLKPVIDPFIGIESHEIKDDHLCTTLEQIRSENLLDYVGTLLDKFSSPDHLKLAQCNLMARFHQTYPKLVEMWNQKKVGGFVTFSSCRRAKNGSGSRVSLTF